MVVLGCEEYMYIPLVGSMCTPTEFEFKRKWQSSGGVDRLWGRAGVPAQAMWVNVNQ